MTETQTTDGI